MREFQIAFWHVRHALPEHRYLSVKVMININLFSSDIVHAYWCPNMPVNLEDIHESVPKRRVSVFAYQGEYRGWVCMWRRYLCLIGWGAIWWKMLPWPRPGRCKKNTHLGGDHSLGTGDQEPPAERMEILIEGQDWSTPALGILVPNVLTGSYTCIYSPWVSILSLAGELLIDCVWSSAYVPYVWFCDLLFIWLLSKDSIYSLHLSWLMKCYGRQIQVSQVTCVYIRALPGRLEIEKVQKKATY